MDMEELEAIQRDIAYRKHTLRFQEQQTNILIEQKVFTKILALATLVLGLSAFLNLFGFEISLTSVVGKPFSWIVYLILTLTAFVLLCFAFVFLVIESLKLFPKKNERRKRK